MKKSVSRDEILDAALTLGSEQGWERLTLHHIARYLHISLAQIHREFPQKDDIVDAWLDRADQAMLAQFPKHASDIHLSNDHSPNTALTTTERLQLAMQSWFDALAPYHKLTGEMLLYKLEPGHIHLQAAGILRISRTVQWFREAAELKASNLQRIGQEIALSSLFIGMFVYWLNDKSPNQLNTRARLQKALLRGNRISLWT
ncbi:TetR/AcrR family transcriptional regulator [Aliidiomarina indica]|uniref:TetR/AcrR family transcriptional regulator n=1 Tax=Aliidiomarina indica TaxID=2749147 RepID=UPI00188EF08A|nr:TetR/AcrR family transcriptional regulator [Aliidiomarina indica]